MGIVSAAVMPLVQLQSGVHRLGMEWGDGTLTACGRSIGGGTGLMQGVLGQVTCIECLVGAGLTRKEALAAIGMYVAPDPAEGFRSPQRGGA